MTTGRVSPDGDVLRSSRRERMPSLIVVVPSSKRVNAVKEVISRFLPITVSPGSLIRRRMLVKQERSRGCIVRLKCVCR